MLGSILLAALFATSATAVDFGTVIIGPGPLPGDTYQEMITAAGQKPNDTSSVTFSRVAKSTSETWTWKLNLTDVTLPRRSPQRDDPDDGMHIAMTQWQLQWPGTYATLQAYLRANSMTMAFAGLQLEVPVTVSAIYDGSGNCSAMLGAQCLDSITTRAGSSAASGSFINLGTGLAGCEETFSVWQVGGFGTRVDSNDTILYYPNSTFITTESAPVAPGNLTQYQKAERMLQMLIVNFRTRVPGGIVNSTPSVVCQIVYNEAPVSAAMDWRRVSMGLLWGVATFCGFAVML